MSRTAVKGGPKRVGACLPDHLRRALSQRLDEDSCLRQAWHACVAEPLASHARPVRYTAGLLFVQADTPAWASRLRHQEPALIAALRRNALFKDLARLRLRVIPRDAVRVEPASPRRPSRLPAEAANTIARAAGGIADPRLRAALERLAESSGSRSDPKRRS